MKRDDIIRMAQEASATGDSSELSGDSIERFAELVVASELATLRARLTASEASRKELREALELYDAALIAAHPQGASGEVFTLWNKARAALANDAEQKGGAA